MTVEDELFWENLRNRAHLHGNRLWVGAEPMLIVWSLRSWQKSDAPPKKPNSRCGMRSEAGKVAK